MSGERACSKCREVKPASEFYPRHTGGTDRLPYCRDCDNAKPRKRNAAKIIRIRARHRAVSALIKRHDDEFRDLLEYHTGVVTEEAEEFARAVAESEHDADETPRLRPGGKRPGQKAGDRIDVSRCPHCVKHHDKGHACPKCGAVPHGALHRPDDGVLDEVAIERRLAGEAVQLTTPELVEAARILAKRGETVTAISRRLGMSGLRVNQALSLEQAS